MAFPLRVLVLLATLALPGCGAIPLGSLVQLSRINFDTTDLAALRSALRLPDGLRPRPGGVKLEVLVKVSGEPDRTTTFLLTEKRDAADISRLPEARRPGFSTYVYALSAEDVGRLEVIRSTLFKYRQDGKSASLGLGVATKEFCIEKAFSAGPLLSTTYLLTSETGRYVIVTKDLDLRKEPATAEEISRLRSC